VIDLHCHILPALDDGAADLSDSVAMAREAAGDGIAVVCATPHIRDDHDVHVEELPARVAELQQELRREGLEVQIVQGAEVAQPTAERLSAQPLTAGRLRELSLGGGGWILLEPAPGALDQSLLALVQRLQALGIRAVIAHPERHAGADFELRLRELTAAGCLIQWTAEFIAEHAGAQGPVAGLAREGLVHLLGSDSHSSRAGRKLRLSPGFERLRELCPAERVRWIEELAPAAILRGDRVVPLG
jgi:protein-tyrosine phosphatase